MSSRPDVYLDDGRWLFRASSIGACLRGLVAARRGISPQPPKAFLQDALAASSVAEGVVKEQLVKRGWTVEPGEHVTLDCEEHGLLTGNTDGFISAVGLGNCVLEIKSLGRDLFRRYVSGGISALGEPFTRMYGMQVSAYMLATGLPCLMVVYGKQSETVLEQLYEVPPFTSEELCERMGQVHSFAERNLYPECDASCSSSSWYWHIHEEQDKKFHTEAELIQKVQKLASIKDTLDELQAQHKKLTDELKVDLGQGAHLIGDYELKVIHRMMPRVDLDRLRKDFGAEFIAPYEYESRQVALTVRRRKRRVTD